MHLIGGGGRLITPPIHSQISYVLLPVDSSNVNADHHHGATTTTSMDTINTDDADMKLGRDGRFSE